MSGRFTLKDTPTGTMIACASASFTGTLKSGSGHSGTGIGSITTGSTRDCGSLGMFTLIPGAMPRHLNLTSYNAAKGVARGTISHLHITLGSTMGCAAVIDGTSASADNGRVVFRYTDRTGRLTVLTTFASLHFYHVSADCVGLVRNGDPATLSAVFAVSPKQAITSP